MVGYPSVVLFPGGNKVGAVLYPGPPRVGHLIDWVLQQGGGGIIFPSQAVNGEYSGSNDVGFRDLGFRVIGCDGAEFWVLGIKVRIQSHQSQYRHLPPFP